MLLHAAARCARAHQRDALDQRFEVIRADLAQQPAHGRRLDLEAGQRAARADEFARERVAVGRRLQVHLDAAVLAHRLHGVVDDRQRAVAEQVHLDEAQVLDGVHVVLRDHIAPGGALQRHIAGQALGRDDHAARVH